jgi:hypothetical protein
MVNVVTGSEAAQHADRLRDAFPNFKTAFLPEYAASLSVFAPQERAYYTVSHNGRPEALFAVHFDRASNSLEATISFARIVLKDKYAAAGWWYVLEVLNHAIRPRGVKIVQAHLETKGSRKTFTDLQARFPYAVNIMGDLGLIYLDQLPPTVSDVS